MPIPFNQRHRMAGLTDAEAQGLEKRLEEML